MACNLTREQNDELCAAIIKSGIEVTEKYMKDHSRVASSSGHVYRNEVYALRQLMFGQPISISTTRTFSRIASSRSGSGTIGPNKVYELRRLLFQRHG
jgi:hypothetical protein